MPIRFRCSYCNRLLGIATRKAGTQTTCPHCGNSITVPIPGDGEGKTERLNLDDVDELLGNTSATAQGSAVAAPPAPAHAAPPKAEQSRAETAAPAAPNPAQVQPPSKPQLPPVPKPAPRPHDPNDPPLFEGDVDEILGKTAAEEEEEKPQRAPTSGMDALSLGEPPRHIVLSGSTATLLVALVVVLMGLSFAAGLFLSPK